MSVVPIAEYTQQGQPQMHGKIRLGGHKTATAPGRKLKTFRFTSPDEHAIRELSAIYGGEPKAWSDPKANPNDQWEVFTDADQIRVWVPPGGLSCFYEAWSGGGCIRRCDGIEVEVAQADDLVSLPCLCKQEGKLTCKPRSRLNVILPDIVFGGVWRCETSGKHAARELPAMERLIDQLQVRGVVEAVLCLEQSQSEGGQKKYVIPRLRLADSALALVNGAASVGMLHPGARAELGPGTPVDAPGATEGPMVGNGGGTWAGNADWFDVDSEVIEAEIVEDYSPSTEAGEGAADLPPVAASPPRRSGLSKQQVRLVLMVKEAAEACGIDEELLRHALSRKASRGATASSKELDAEAASQVMAWAEELVGGLPIIVVSENPPKVKLG